MSIFDTFEARRGGPAQVFLPVPSPSLSLSEFLRGSPAAGHWRHPDRGSARFRAAGPDLGVLSLAGCKAEASPRAAPNALPQCQAARTVPGCALRHFGHRGSDSNH